MNKEYKNKVVHNSLVLSVILSVIGIICLVTSCVLRSVCGYDNVWFRIVSFLVWIIIYCLMFLDGFLSGARLDEVAQLKEKDDDKDEEGK